MKFALMILTALTLSACGSNSSNKDGHAAVGVSPQMTKVTTNAECQGAPAHALTDAFFGWHTAFEAPRIQFTLNFQFDRFGQLKMTGDCAFDGIGRLSASTSTGYQDNGMSFAVLADAYQEERSGGMTCNVSVARGTVQYGFEGSCLVLNDPKAGKLYLVPN